MPFSRAFHGSPALFEKFDTDFIGSGEGNQAYGWGLYFGGRREVAQHYQRALATRAADMMDWSTVTLPDSLTANELRLFRDLSVKLRKNAQDGPPLTTAESAQWRALYDKNRAYDDAVQAAKPKGRLYEVELAPKESEYLDWDKPLDKQSASVRDTLHDMLDDFVNREETAAVIDDLLNGEVDDLTGKEIVRLLDKMSEREVLPSNGPGVEQANDDGNYSKAASLFLLNEGIPGIKYLDGSSRNSGEGSHNYVIFDAKDVEVEAMFSRQRNPDTFYSQMIDVLEKKLPGAGAPGQIKQMIQAWAAKGDIKKEELQWSGVEAWLDAQPKKVTKEEVLAFARANQIEVKEVELRDDLRSERAVKFGPETHPTLSLPGDTENYRELLLTLPDKHQARRAELLSLRDQAYSEGRIDDLDALDKEYFSLPPQQEFRSDHFDEPNILAHVRFNERIDTDGKRVLFVEEAQSDLHREGREKGINTDASKWTVANTKHESDKWVVRDAQGNQRWSGYESEDAARDDLAQHAKRGLLGGVPDAPFKTTWPMLVMKRMIRWAAENDFDRLAWITGEQTQERYNLRKQVRRIAWTRDGENDRIVTLSPTAGNDIEFRVLPDGRITGISRLGAGTPFDGHTIQKTVGTEIGNRILAERNGDLSGLDLKIGGEWAINLYDRQLPNEVNKYVKKWGGRVGHTDFDAGEYKVRRDSHDPPYRLESEGSPDIISRHATAEEAWAEAERLGNTRVHALDITPAMKSAVTETGQSLFSRQRDADALPSQSKKAVDIMAAMDESIKAIPTNPAKWIKAKAEETRGNWLGALSLRALADYGADKLPRLKLYIRIANSMFTTRNRLTQQSHATVKAWQQYHADHKAERDETANLMHDATIHGVDVLLKAYKPLVNIADMRKQIATIEHTIKVHGGKDSDILFAKIKRMEELIKVERERKLHYPALRKRYMALSKDGRALYARVQKDHARRAEMLQAELEKKVNRLKLSASAKAVALAELREEFEVARMQGPYFPLARFGDYWISVTKTNNPDLDEDIFIMSKSSREHEAMLKTLAARKLVVKSGKKMDAGKMLEGASASFVTAINGILKTSGAPDSTRDEIYQLYLRTMPDVSARKRHLHRRKIKGYSHDALRAYAHTTFHGSYNLAKVMHSDQLEGMLNRMKEDRKDSDTPEKADDLFNEMVKRHQWIMNPSNAGWVNQASALNFFWYLGATPAAALVNVTQTPLVAFPVLAARYGMVQASKQLLKAAGDIIRGKGSIVNTLSGDRKQAYEQFVFDGVIDKTLSHDLAGIGEQPSVSYNPLQQKVMEKVAWLFHTAEVFNREATAMAAYDLARAGGKGIQPMNHQDAMAYARDATLEAHYDYSNANRARMMQGDVAKVLLMFRQFSFNMLWQLGWNTWQSFKGESKAVRLEARKKITGILGMHGVAAGAMGLPVFGAVAFVMNSLSELFGDDDEPYDFDTEFRNFLADYFPAPVARIIAKGAVNELTGMDVASRVGLNNLLLREPDRDLDGQGMWAYTMEQIAGPMGGIIGSLAMGYDQMMDGDVWRGFETMAPKSVKDYMRAARYTREGVLSTQGAPIMDDLTLWEIFLKSQGMNPARLSDRYAANSAVKTYESRINNRRLRLMTAHAMAENAHDFRARHAAMTKIRDFNRTHPGFAISNTSLKQSATRREANRKEAQHGILVNPNLSYIRQVGRFAD